MRDSFQVYNMIIYMKKK